MVNFDKLIDNYLLYRQNNQDSYHEVKNGVFHPSSIGRCQRSLYFDFVIKNQDDYNAGTLRIFYLGNVIHKYIQKLFEFYSAKGKAIKLIGNELTFTKEFDDFKIIGSVDSIIEFKGEKYVIEIKSTSKWLSGITSPYLGHIAQANCYMNLSGIKKAIILYVGKNYLDVKYFTIEYDDVYFNSLMKKLKNVNTCIKHNKVPEKQCNEFECRYCNYKKECRKYD